MSSQMQTRLVALTLAAGVLTLPLMLGNRTAEAMSHSLLMMLSLALVASLLAFQSGAWRMPKPAWLIWGGVFTALAAWFGPYPTALLEHSSDPVQRWSPDPGATVRGWAVWVALFTVAWLMRGLSAPERGLIWLALVLMALFQSLYGLLAHASGSQMIFGIWERNNPGFVHGSFSNRNLYAAFLALSWPLAVCIWFSRDVPMIGRWPKELRIAAAVICGAAIGAALLGSASRLGAAAGVFGIMLALLLLGQHRRLLHGASVWPAWMAAAAGLVAATWYGLTPLAERLLATSAEEARIEVARIMLTDFPPAWWIHGVGLGGFEAAFKQFQPAHISGWFDFAHNDLLQWWVETGLVGMALLLVVVGALVRRFRLDTERIALYAGLAALSIIALGDFSWHLPATQFALALFLGALLAPRRKRRSSGGISGSKPRIE